MDGSPRRPWGRSRHPRQEPGLRASPARGRQGRGDGRAPAVEGGARRLPHLLRRRRQDHPGAACSSSLPAPSSMRWSSTSRATGASFPYRTQVPLALEAGAQGPVIIKDFEGFIASLKARGIYTVARIVTFKDTVLAQATARVGHHRHAHRQALDRQREARLGRPLPRRGAGTTSSPSPRRRSRKGFDEVQFDYVRFPTDGKLSAASYSQPSNCANPAARHRRLPREGPRVSWGRWVPS